MNNKLYTWIIRFIKQSDESESNRQDSMSILTETNKFGGDMVGLSYLGALKWVEDGDCQNLNPITSEGEIDLEIINELMDGILSSGSHVKDPSLKNDKKAMVIELVEGTK